MADVKALVEQGCLPHSNILVATNAPHSTPQSIPDVSTFNFVSFPVRVYVCMCMCVHVYACTCVCIYLLTYVFACVLHTHPPTHTHTHTMQCASKIWFYFSPHVTPGTMRLLTSCNLLQSLAGLYAGGTQRAGKYHLHSGYTCNDTRNW
jgi:hypothetical protein